MDHEYLNIINNFSVNDLVMVRTADGNVRAWIRELINEEGIIIVEPIGLRHELAVLPFQIEKIPSGGGRRSRKSLRKSRKSLRKSRKSLRKSRKSLRKTKNTRRTK
jgi:hypothetical protein